MTVDTTVAALASWMQSLGDSLPLLGYSQGARVALLLALEHPSLVSQLILVSGSVGIPSEAVRERRRQADDVIAAEIERAGVAAFLDDWLRQPLVSTTAVPPEVAAQDRAVRSKNTAPGLAAAMRGLGQGTYPFVGDRLHELAMPVLTVAGGQDQKYRALAVEVAAAVPLGRVEIVAAAGHNVVLEQPEAVAALVAGFLAETGD